MDLIAHAVYGATVCSRTGLAGGRQGPPVRPWFKDRTAWWAALFGVVPDLLSMGLPWWRHPEIVALYWSLPLLTWLGLSIWRRISRSGERREPGLVPEKTRKKPRNTRS